jgi:hypothetical protein
MPRSGLEPPWTQIDREAGRNGLTAQEMMMGHPSAPGPRDEKVVRAGQPGPGVDGVPGVPLLKPGRRGTPGFPANSGGGFPVQPDADYLGEHDF